MARRPQPRARLRCRRPFEPLAAELVGDRLHGGRLFGHTGLAAVEFHQQHRRFGQAQLVAQVDGAHRVRIEQLAAGNGHTELDDLDGGAHRRVDTREGAHRRQHRLGQRVQAQRDLGHHAERAFAADHQAREVVAGARLARARAGADHLALRRDDGEAEHVLAHRAVAHGIRATGAGGRHAAQARVGAGVDGEEEAAVADLVVELGARHARLHRDREVVGRERHDLLHARQVDAHTALHRQQMPFERGAHAEGNDRHRMRIGQRHDEGDLLGALAVDDQIRRRHVERRLVAAMLLAHRERRRAALAEVGLQGLVHRRRHRAAFHRGQHMGGKRGVHGQAPTTGIADAPILRFRAKSGP